MAAPLLPRSARGEAAASFLPRLRGRWRAANTQRDGGGAKAPNSTHAIAIKNHTQAKALRRTLTPPEAILWARLRARQPDGPRIRRQHPVGPYIADFYCADARLVIEIDGWGHNMGDRPRRDERRDSWMAEQGLTVARYPADEVIRDPNAVADGIWDTCMALARSGRG